MCVVRWNRYVQIIQTIIFIIIVNCIYHCGVLDLEFVYSRQNLIPWLTSFFIRYNTVTSDLTLNLMSVSCFNLVFWQIWKQSEYERCCCSISIRDTLHIILCIIEIYTPVLLYVSCNAQPFSWSKLGDRLALKVVKKKKK